MNEGAVSLLVSVPICSFRKGYAREYLETEETPPTSTIYGFLLALIGEEDRRAYTGSKIAYALLASPAISVILRTSWRIKKKALALGVGENRRPDYQEIMTGLQIGLWLQDGELAQRVKLAGSRPQDVTRFGGLSLGESKDLVNDVVWFPSWQQKEAYWVVADKDGNIPLPIWVDHVGSKQTIYGQFHFALAPLETPPADDPRWIRIEAPKTRDEAS